MTRILSDSEILLLIGERKPLPQRWSTRLKPKPVSGQSHLRKKLEIKGHDGNEFVIDLRVNSLDQLDFSVIHSFIDQDGQRYIITRFNGKHQSIHTNKWEKKYGKANASFRPCFHIHRATERYQNEGFAIDGYAEVTSEYASFDAALRCFLQSNGFVQEGDDQPLFDNLE
jgi:hypothetical protein